jgi:hypothetical protein
MAFLACCGILLFIALVAYMRIESDSNLNIGSYLRRLASFLVQRVPNLPIQ